MIREAGVRGTDDRTGQLFSSVDLEARIRAEHPLRKIRAVANEALQTIGSDLRALYCDIGPRSRRSGC